jgi:hypothetical protein
VNTLQLWGFELLSTILFEQATAAKPKSAFSSQIPVRNASNKRCQDYRRKNLCILYKDYRTKLIHSLANFWNFSSASEIVKPYPWHSGISSHLNEYL